MNHFNQKYFRVVLDKLPSTKGNKCRAVRLDYGRNGMRLLVSQHNVCEYRRVAVQILQLLIQTSPVSKLLGPGTTNMGTVTKNSLRFAFNKSLPDFHASGYIEVMFDRKSFILAYAVASINCPTSKGPRPPFAANSACNTLKAAWNIFDEAGGNLPAPAHVGKHFAKSMPAPTRIGKYYFAKSMPVPARIGKYFTKCIKA